MAELGSLASSDDAALWAHRSLSDKNTLTAADALQVEEAFATRVTGFAGTEPSTRSEPPLAHSKTQRTKAPKSRARKKTIDKSVLTLPEPRQLRDRHHVKFVTTHPCLICGRQPADVHHLRFMQSRALGRKVSDEFTVPLCRGHHREVHRCGNEAAWWRKACIDPVITARRLWIETHPLPQGQDSGSRPNPI